MSQHKDYPISALPAVQVGQTFTVSIMHTLADYSGSGREEDLGAFVKLEIHGGDGSIRNGSMELLIGALRGAQRAADEYNDRLAKVKEKKRKKVAKAGRVF